MWLLHSQLHSWLKPPQSFNAVDASVCNQPVYTEKSIRRFLFAQNTSARIELFSQSYLGRFQLIFRVSLFGYLLCTPAPAVCNTHHQITATDPEASSENKLQKWSGQIWMLQRQQLLRSEAPCTKTLKEARDIKTTQPLQSYSLTLFALLNLLLFIKFQSFSHIWSLK